MKIYVEKIKTKNGFEMPVLKADKKIISFSADVVSYVSGLSVRALENIDGEVVIAEVKEGVSVGR